MKLYVAGSSAERPRYREAVRGIEEHITYNWEAGFQRYEEAIRDCDLDRAEEILGTAGIRCASGVRAADTFILLIPKTPSRGAWLELGIAHERAFGFERGIQLFSVGETTNLDIWEDLFAAHFDTMDECLAHLGIERGAA